MSTLLYICFRYDSIKQGILFSKKSTYYVVFAILHRLLKSILLFLRVRTFLSFTLLDLSLNNDKIKITILNCNLLNLQVCRLRWRQTFPHVSKAEQGYRGYGSRFKQK